MTLLVLRPQPGAAATAAAARAAGLATVVAPLFTIAPVPWRPPAQPPQALLVTSANALRMMGAVPSAWRGLPTFAVGAATAAAARAAGLRVVHAGDRDGMAAATAARAAGHGRLLHPCGADRRPIAVAGVTIEDLVVYLATPAAALAPEAAAAWTAGAVAMLHSPAAARLFGTLADAARLPRGRGALVAISPRAARAAGDGWDRVAIAPVPADAAMLALARALCQERAMPGSCQR